MNHNLSKILLLALLLVLALAACQSDESRPEAAYQAYYQACEESKYDSAAEYLTDEAQKRIDSIGVCGFTHDAINRYEVARGGTERVFAEEPVVDSDETNAAITWIDDQGKIAIVQLMKTGGGWKIKQTVWSD